jgi:2-hydroxy-6-oxonona-2,4-dienedioate hydrolase
MAAHPCAAIFVCLIPDRSVCLAGIGRPPVGREVLLVTIDFADQDHRAKVFVQVRRYHSAPADPGDWVQKMRKILFLPGTGGSPEFWKPVAKLLQDQRGQDERDQDEWDQVFFGWPGLGDQPHDPAIKSVDDLVRLVDAEIDGPVDLVAQSMGGVIAARIALSRSTAVRRLVLAVTSGGINVTQFGASDWRADYRREFPRAADWITQPGASVELPVELIVAPTLLLWGDCDPISPVAIGLHLERRMPNAKLHIVPGGDHDLASNKAEVVAALIARHLM